MRKPGAENEIDSGPIASGRRERAFDLWQRLKIGVIATAGWSVVWFLGSTVRFRVEGWEVVAGLKKVRTPMILSFWHNQILLATYFWRFRDIVVITSRHFDGEYIARVIRRFGYGAARGSTTRGAVKALLELRGHLRERRDVAFTVDGPRGPVYQVKPGPILLARKTGLPIVCFHVEPKRYWSLKSWDRFRIPKPFTPVLVKIGKPLRFERNSDPGTDLGKYQVEMEELRKYCEAYDWSADPQGAGIRTDC